MERTDLSLRFSHLSAPKDAALHRVREICVRSLDISEEEAGKLFEPRGTLLISTDKEPVELRQIVQKLEQLGVLVNSSKLESHYPLWPSAPHFPRSPTSPRLSQRPHQLSALGDARYLTRRAKKALLSRAAWSLLCVAFIALTIMSALRISTWPIAEKSQTFPAALPAQSSSAVKQEIELTGPDVRTFTGISSNAGLHFTMKVSVGNGSITVRLSANASRDEILREHSIQSLESDPVFLEARGAQNFVGTSPTVISELSEPQRRFPGQTSISLHTLSDGTPQYALVRVNRLPTKDSDRTEPWLVATTIINLLP